MLMDAETYEKHKDELEKPHPPRNYLDKTLFGRVHWVSPDGQSVMAYFWDADNPGVSDGYADGWLGDAMIETETSAKYKIGDKILGKVCPGITMIRMMQEFSRGLLHMTPEQRAEFTKDWTDERRRSWEEYLNEKRRRWQIGLEFE